MRTARRIGNILIWTLVSLYLFAILLFRIPMVQKAIGIQVAGSLSAFFDTEVSVGGVDCGFLNRIIIDDVKIKDQRNKELVRAGRLSVKVDLLPLLDGKVVVTSAQVFGMHLTVYKDSESDPTNLQFVLDRLTSKDEDESSPINLKINSLIVRNASVSYDQFDAPHTPGLLNAKHLNVSRLNLHAKLRALTEDTLDVSLKRLTLKESSGLDIRRMAVNAAMGRSGAEVTGFTLQMPHTSVTADTLKAVWRFGEDNKMDYGKLKFKGRLNPSYVTPSDVCCLVKGLENFDDELKLNAEVSGTSSYVAINSLNIHSDEGNINMDMSGYVTNLRGKPTFKADLKELSLSAKTIDFISQNLKGQEIDVPEALFNLGRVAVKGTLASDDYNKLTANCDVQTDAGHIGVDMRWKRTDDINATLDAKNFRLSTIAEKSQLGELTANIKLQGNMKQNAHKAVADIKSLDFRGHQYTDVTLDLRYTPSLTELSLVSEAQDAAMTADASMTKTVEGHRITANAKLKRLNPKRLNLTDYFGEADLSATVTANIEGHDINDVEGNLSVSDFRMRSADDSYTLKQLDIIASTTDNDRAINVYGDIGSMMLRGEYDLKAMDFRNCRLIADIVDAKAFEKIMRLPLHLDEAFHAYASVNEYTRQINIGIQGKSFSYDGQPYRNLTVDVSTVDTMATNTPGAPTTKLLAPHSTLLTNNSKIAASIDKLMDDGTQLSVSLKGQGQNGVFKPSLEWHHNGGKKLTGIVESTVDFFKDGMGHNVTHVRLMPSAVFINEKPWNIAGSDIYYSQQHLVVNNFNVSQGEQHLTVDGRASASVEDTIRVNLNGINVEYVMDLINFHSVDFAGSASGTAYLTSLFSPDLDFGANLTVDDFTFENGRMGQLRAKADWNKTLGQIDIDAIADDTDTIATVINGYVSPTANYIDLDIKAQGTRADFVENFTSSFLSDIKGNLNGRLRLAGPLNKINLTGKAIGGLYATVKPLNCRYQLTDIKLNLVEDTINIESSTIYDKHNYNKLKHRVDHQGVFSGRLTHKHLTKLAYDLNAEVTNMQVYDYEDFGDELFCGTIYGDGTATMRGKPGENNIDINISPARNSEFRYNATPTEDIASQEYITWRDPSADNRQSTADNRQPATNSQQPTPNIPQPTNRSDMRLNMHIAANPNLTIRLILNDQTGDFMTLNGSGDLNAIYYNKGGFNLYGTYGVTGGEYALTIQDIIHKRFSFNQGGAVVFNGDPFNAALNLQAVYTANGVSLSDLNLGSSFTANTIKVNCLMNITGTPAQPVVGFDMDMPTASTDQVQMIRSVLNTQDELNKQMVYLLAVGRFYPQGANNSMAQADGQLNPTQRAMQSLLSGTISGQLNNMLGSFINSNNWTFGANIATGDAGWNNAEYEGLLSGKLFNNRLLFNGQFGYRDDPTRQTAGFIGEFDIQWLMTPNGEVSVKFYNQANDRYFTKSTLSTQGLGLILKRDFTNLRDLFRKSRK